ncbi:MAG TPA: hypothetical protein VE732_06605 [Nitrososphaera sp.]|jgi:hypothetical protein|nr:hypothetical protein [Nitrososphaera sp.]
MTDEEREKLIKEIRLIVLNDLSEVLDRVINQTDANDARNQMATGIQHFLQQRTNEILRDRAD